MMIYLIVSNMVQNIFCMMPCIFYPYLALSGLSWGTDDQTLKEAFTSFGNVIEG